MSVARPVDVRGPLRPVELATAAVMAGLTVVLVVVGVIVPIATILQTVAVVPMGVIAHRHRPRALVAGGVAAMVVGFLVAGTAPVTTIFVAALVGGIVGDVKRRGRGVGTAALAFTVAAPGVAALSVLVLLGFTRLRELTLLTIRNSANGVASLVSGLPGGTTVADGIRSSVDLLVRNWWWTVSAGVALGIVFTGVIAWLALGAVLSRLERQPITTFLDAPTAPDATAPGPVPVALVDAGLRYPGARTDTLSGVDLTLDGPELVVVVGRNGSGKSTVVRMLAGAPPTTGHVHRAGPVGLGAPGGTAMIFQSPESQVLGVRVRDDVVWGMPAGADVDIDALLATVGLAGTADRATTTLSGGQLQRLAVASALARRPRLLLSDESTAMVDPQGRAELVAVLAQLPAREGMTVVHVTHRAADAELAQRVVAVHDGRVTELVRTPGSGVVDPPAPRPLPPPGPPVLQLHGVGHVYDARTPWAHRALSGVELQVGRGEAVLLVGGNGSGKSTLAWVLAGLLRPTEGRATLGGRPVSGQVGSVAIAFQHARLQMQRPTVGEDISAAGPAVRCRGPPGGGGPRGRGAAPVHGGRRHRHPQRRATAPGRARRAARHPPAGAGARRAAGRARRRQPGRPRRGADPPAGRVRPHPRRRLPRRGRAGAHLPPGGAPRGRPGGARRSCAGTGPPVSTILREVPRDTPVHRLWAGTKLICVAALGLSLSLVASWAAIGIVAALVVAVAALARVPATALPRLRPWFWALLIGAALLSVPSGGAPELSIGGATLGLGAVLIYVRLTVLAAVIIIAALLLGATTALGDIAPAVARLGAPLRAVRIPVDEFAVTVALCVRAFPLLADDFRVLAAARRLRREQRRRTWTEVNVEVVDLMVTGLTVSMRRSAELGEAITARGGTGRLAADPGRPRPRDLVAFVVVGAVCVLVFVVG